MARKYLSDKELARALEDSDEERDSFSEESVDSRDDPDYNASDTEDEFSEDEAHQLLPDSRPSTPLTPTTHQQPADPSAAGTNSSHDFENIVWGVPVGNQQNFPYTGNGGMDQNISGILALAEPIDYFSLFFTNDIVNIMVDETNFYAQQTLEKADDVSSSSRLHKWNPTDAKEMRKFVGLIGYMGVVKVPELSDYWSQSQLFSFPLPKNIMSRNRFELLLKFWHFANNDEAVPGNRTHKIEKIFKEFIKNFQSVYTPNETICIDETMVPFRGRISFRQYIPSKRHRYGLKLYKLCTEKGYTWNVSLYVGKDTADNGILSASQNIVMKLIEGLLDEGRTLYIDNFYTSLPLAYLLLERKTHTVGTLRANRKYIPKEVQSAKLAKGEIFAKESPEGITILKWRDQREVRMLSTRHNGTDTVVVKTKRQTEKVKPKCILDYDMGKSPVDVSDQLASYNTALRRCYKWYRKVIIELLWGTSLVNSHFLYTKNCINSNNMSITKYREKVILSLLEDTEEPSSSNKRKRSIHHLITHDQKKRARCTGCYELYGRKGQIVEGHKKMAAQVITICDACDGNPHYCRECFNRIH